MSYIPAVFSKESVTFYVEGVPYMADQTVPGYADLLVELRKPDADPARAIALASPAAAVATAVANAEATYLEAGVFSVSRSEIRYNGEPIHGVLVDRILSLLADGHDFLPMVNFMQNLYMNPATYARDELYLWLETSNLPITQDGHFLAYKVVNADFTSTYDNRTDNSPGTIPAMPRETVDPDRHNTCSQGLHFCSYDYIDQYGFHSGRKLVLLKINPADVVSIPSDYSNVKGRAWKYEVLQEVAHEGLAARQWDSVWNEDEEDEDDDAWKPMIDADGNFNDDEALIDLEALIDAATDAELGFDTEDDEATTDESNSQDAGILPFAEAATSSSDGGKANPALRALGIVKLRREASRLGLKHAWRGGYTAEQLADYIAAQESFRQ